MDELTEERERVQKELEEYRDTVARKDDELETTKRNYEEQHRLMTEHICVIAQNQSALEDELSMLRAEKKQAAKKK